MTPTFLDEQRPKSLPGLCSHKNISGIGNFKVLSTNGLIAHCERTSDGMFMELHHDSIDFPKTETYSGPRKPKADKPQPKKVKRKSLDDLLAEYL